MSVPNLPHESRSDAAATGEFPWFSWRIKKTGRTILLSLSGAADVETASVFAQVLDDATSYGLPVILDCASLDYMDATGLDVLLEYRQRVPRMLLAKPGAAVRTLVDRQLLGGFFPAYDSLDTALTALGPISTRRWIRAGCDIRLFGSWRPRASRGRRYE